MKTKFNTLLLGIVVNLVFLSANAEELNVGKQTNKENVINLFKSGRTEAPAAAAEDSSHDEDIGDTVSKEPGRSIKQITISEIHPKPIKPKEKEVALSMEVLFDYNSAKLSDAAKAQLNPIGEALASPDLKGKHFRIEGHTDVVGSDDYNINLSLQRAEAVKDYLYEHFGLDASIIQVEGKGKSGLADPNNPDSEVNRRVRVIKLGS